jgi:hypothetical protein
MARYYEHGVLCSLWGTDWIIKYCLRQVSAANGYTGDCLHVTLCYQHLYIYLTKQIQYFKESGRHTLLPKFCCKLRGPLSMRVCVVIASYIRLPVLLLDNWDLHSEAWSLSTHHQLTTDCEIKRSNRRHGSCISMDNHFVISPNTLSVWSTQAESMKWSVV